MILFDISSSSVFLQNRNIFLDNPTLCYLEKAQFFRTFFAPFAKTKFSTSLFKQLKKLHFQRLPSSGPKADKSSIKKLLFIYWTQYKNYYASTIPRSPTTKAANFKGTSCVKTINEEPTGPLGSICPNRLMASMFWDSSSYVYYRYELCMFYIPFLGPLRPLVPPLVDPSVRARKSGSLDRYTTPLTPWGVLNEPTPPYTPPDLLLRIPTPDGVTDRLGEVKAMSAGTSRLIGGQESCRHLTADLLRGLIRGEEQQQEQLVLCQRLWWHG